MTSHLTARALRPGAASLLLAPALCLALGGCSVLRQFSPSVEVSTLTPGEYVQLKRGDILTSGSLSSATTETIAVAAAESACVDGASTQCIEVISGSDALTEERRHSALSELWLSLAMASAGKKANKAAEATAASDTVSPWMHVARHAYVYLFFSERRPHDRAFEDRQTQVRDYYNLAVQEVTATLFHSMEEGDRQAETAELRNGPWTFAVDIADELVEAEGGELTELLPASTLYFTGLRSTYRRDGFGGELVAVTASQRTVVKEVEEGTFAMDPAKAPAWSVMNTPAVTMLLDFQGDTLDQVLASRHATLKVFDPYRTERTRLRDQEIPLAANFTAGYGLWLARSGFNRQSLESLFGGKGAVEAPQLFMMQPFDPDRGVILMVHGLASSPEAWVNVANELGADEQIRDRYQVWQIYYPTNVPIAINHVRIRHLLRETLRQVDPQGTAAASDDIVVLGHSMGGILSRLMVSSSGNTLWKTFVEDRNVDPERLAKYRNNAEAILRFEPMPEISTAIFVAAPHRGTDAAGKRLAQFIGRLVVLPVTMLKGMGEALSMLVSNDPDGKARRAPRNGLQNLDRKDPFIRVARDLPIGSGVTYHSIIAQQLDGALADSTDGVVPYWSSHLPGAATETIIRGEHSVQESPEAIAAMRRILKDRLNARAAGLPDALPAPAPEAP